MDTDPEMSFDPAEHPANRPVEPEHPMILDGAVVPGDMVLMARCIIEEMLMLGFEPAELAQMSHDTNYQALFAMRSTLGNEHFDAIFDQTLGRIGRHHHVTREHRGDIQSVSLTVNSGPSQL